MKGLQAKPQPGKKPKKANLEEKVSRKREESKERSTTVLKGSLERLIDLFHEGVGEAME